MMRAPAILAVGLSLSVSAMANAEPAVPKPQLKTLAEVNRALTACWRWPPLREARSGMELTIKVSFKRNGEVFGSQITYQTPNVPDEERSVYFGALSAALARCAPLPFSEGLGEAIAGRPLFIHIHDTRQQRKA